MLRCALFVVSLATSLSAQIDYLLQTNPGGSSAYVMADVAESAPAQFARIEPQLDHYTAIAPHQLTQTAAAQHGSGNRTAWQRVAGTHTGGEDLSHWRIGGRVRCELNRTGGALSTFHWNEVLALTISEVAPRVGTLRMEVRRVLDGTPQFHAPPTGTEPRLAVLADGRRYVTSAGEPRFVSPHVGELEQPAFTEVEFTVTPLPQTINLSFSGSLQTTDAGPGSCRVYEYSLSFWPGAAPLTPLVEKPGVTCLATFQRVPLAGRTDEIVFRAEFDSAHPAYAVQPEAGRWLTFWSVGELAPAPLPALAGHDIEVDIFGVAYNGIEHASYRKGREPDCVKGTMALPIDHGTWYLQWVVSDGWLDRTITSRTYRVH